MDNEQNNHAIDYPVVYRASKGWRVVFVPLMLVMMCVFAQLIIRSFVGNDLNGVGHRVFLFAIGAVFDIFLGYSIYAVLSFRVEVYPAFVIIKSGFKIQRLSLKEIAGFKILPTQYFRTAQLTFHEQGKKKFDIPLIMDQSDRFKKWLAVSLKYIDAEDYKNEINAILSDQMLGPSSAQRADVLLQAKKVVRWLDIASVVGVLWALILPRPYEMAIGTLIALPIVALFVADRFRGLIKIDGPPQGPYPIIALPFLMPGLVLSLRAFTDWKILFWNHFWLPFFIISLLFFLFIRVVFSDAGRRYGQAAVILVFCVIYGYGSAILLNGMNDNSEPTLFVTKVMDKVVSSGRRTSYEVKLAPWGPQTLETEVHVSKRFYDSVLVGNRVVVCVKEGHLHIPWFFLKKEGKCD